MEVAASPDEVLAFAQSVERAGARYLASSDHVPTTQLPDDHASATMMSWDYHEPFVSCAVPTARTRLDLTTSLPVPLQRPAALVAKQLAELTRWFGDRFRLGVGSGWNMAEVRALGVSFAERGPILTEQAAVIGSFWAGGAVDYHGRHHTLTGVGIDTTPRDADAPAVVQRPRLDGDRAPCVTAGAGSQLHGPDDERTRTALGLLHAG